ncbi:HAD-like domain-containing protein [Thelonectria olida]|uniref:HAD-like domain-containing protein n=1 Tax=Thelonectria olida TaxID=1576542 RepID=A0A9P9AZ17_9HYPO|nr:HAD-like domain-containing protein [Thelonectria olida]
MPPGKISSFAKVKALAFDVFGTVVDWRTSVVEEITLRAHRKASSDLPDHLKARVQSMSEEDWDKFAQEWRNSYGVFCHTFDPDRDAWKDVDQHHRDSLVELLEKWNLSGLFTETEIDSLSLVWHRLQPWDDSSRGLEKLGKTYVTSTLSNGNLSLLHDLDDFGSLGFKKFLSAETFKAYKPNPAVYLGAARNLGVEPEEMALVAAHLGDLEAAKSCGFRTIYIERLREEDWSKNEDKYKQAKGWVDIWVTEEEDGILSVAQKLSEVA